MRRRLVFICCILFSVSLFAQENEVRTAFDLGVGQEFLAGPSSVKFLGVVSDSRCPKNVTCIWPGEAKVLLGITAMGKYLEKEVVVSGTGTEFTIADDLQVLVAQLRPYPQTALPIAPGDYCLSITAVGEKEN